ncbi:MAG: protein jag [Clostridia bacterium]|nr:protein jag [Clostridia bacterium]
MRAVEISAKTVEEAIRIALEQLGLEKEDVNIDILEQPNKGFLGILGNKNALVRVEEKFNPVKYSLSFLKNVLARMDLDPQIDVEENDEYIIFNLTGKDLGVLIGRRGDTLDALQFLTNLVVNKKSTQKKKIIIDVENYRNRRKETLINLANRLAEKAKKSGKKIVLEPMSPQERRIIHITLQDNKYISTYSEGEEPYRKVIIVPKK